MSTMLSHNRTVPLWGFIVIIAVGSIIIPGGVFLALRYYIKHKHHESDSDSVRSDPETVRRVTVRRGRIVPQSHYLSLTGSRFGVGAFSDDARSGARSKSPFEWWNNVHSRSNSLMSKNQPDLILTGDTPRKQAPSPLRTVASFEPMSEKPPAYSFPSKPMLAHRPPTMNFSRPALGLQSLSIASSLPQIVEASPHQSMISSRQSRQSSSEKAPSTAVSELGTPRSPTSMIGFGSRANSHADISSTISEEPFKHHPAVKRQRSHSRIPRPTHSVHTSRSRSLPRSPRPVSNGFEPPPTSRRPSAGQTDRRPSTTHSDRRPSMTSRPSISQPSRTSSVNYLDSRKSLPHSPRRSTSTLNSKRSSSYRAPGDADHVTGQLSNASIQALPLMSPVPAYWETRQDIQPVRRKSQKGKVLRKKSLQRAERTSWVT